MIPEFPKFKKIELSDKKEVEKFTFKYPPYADFNFAGIWSWNVHEKIHISQLNNNYVIKFADYSTGKHFYTFLGENKVTETTKTLLDLSKKENLKPELKLISEETTQQLNSSIFKIEEDRDNFDYIFDLKELKEYAGQKFSKKRNRFNVFVKTYPTAEARVISLQDTVIQKNILNLYHKWFNSKIENDKDFENHKELLTIEKFFSSKDTFNLLSMGVFLNEELIAFSIDEILPSEYVVSHVVKIDHNFSGVHEFLLKKSSEALFSMGKHFLNQEQDLGLENLRQSKERFRPCKFLKKYIVTYL